MWSIHPSIWPPVLSSSRTEWLTATVLNETRQRRASSNRSSRFCASPVQSVLTSHPTRPGLAEVPLPRRAVTPTQLRRQRRSSPQRRGAGARRQYSKAKLAARAGRVWDPLDVMMCGGESQADSAGVLLGPAVRASSTRAGGSQLVGSQLMEPHEREVLRSDPACKLMAEGVELCLRNLSHGRCPHSHTDPPACKLIKCLG